MLSTFGGEKELNVYGVLYLPGAARHIHDLISLPRQALELVDGVIPICTDEKTGTTRLSKSQKVTWEKVIVGLD